MARTTIRMMRRRESFDIIGFYLEHMLMSFLGYSPAQPGTLLSLIIKLDQQTAGNSPLTHNK